MCVNRRDKVRSYSKTNITHSETSNKQRNNNVSIVDAANMDVLRLDAWGSLLFISSAFQACDNVRKTLLLYYYVVIIIMLIIIL